MLLTALGPKMLATRSSGNEQLPAQVAKVHSAKGATHVVIVALFVVQATTSWAATALSLPCLNCF